MDSIASPLVGAVAFVYRRPLLGLLNRVIRIRSKSALVAIALLRVGFDISSDNSSLHVGALPGWLGGVLPLTRAPTSLNAPPQKNAEEDPRSCPSTSVAMDTGAQASCVAVAR